MTDKIKWSDNLQTDVTLLDALICLGALRGIASERLASSNKFISDLEIGVESFIKLQHDKIKQLETQLGAYKTVAYSTYGARPNDPQRV